jgi:hypothetical protein
MDRVVKICVGGALFRERASVLTTRSEFFAALLSDRWSGCSDEEVFVDRDPDAFEAMLALMRDPTFRFPVELWGHELDFYGVSPPDASITNSLRSHRKLDAVTLSLDLDTLLETALRGASEEDRKVAYCDRWCVLDPRNESFDRRIWELPRKWCQEIREMEVVLALSFESLELGASRTALLENGVIAEALGPRFQLIVGGMRVWNCSGGCIARHELLLNRNSVEEVAEQQRESLLTKYLYGRNAKGDLVRTFRLRLPFWPWAVGEEERTKGVCVDGTISSSLRHHPSATLYHQWQVEMLTSSTPTSPGWALESVQLRVLGRTYAEPRLSNDPRLERAFAAFDWQSHSLSPSEVKLADSEWIFRLKDCYISTLPKDRLVFQLLVNGKPARIAKASVVHRIEFLGPVELYSGTEFELLEEMAEIAGWWPSSPVYAIFVGELRGCISTELLNAPEDLQFGIVPSESPPTGAVVSLELDLCLRNLFGYVGNCGHHLYVN